MRSGASYSVRGGSLRVRKVVATNSQGKKTVKKICQFQFDCPMVFQELLTVCNFKSGYMKVGIPLEVRYFLTSLSVPYQLKLRVE